MSKEVVKILFPVGRLVGGSVHKAEPNTDNLGKPKLYASGPNAGQPMTSYYVPVAIPKEPGHTHWAQTVWGKQIWELAHRAWPGGQTQQPTFAWKITDGDSTIPNKKQKRPCDQPGHAGHWVLKFGTVIAPKLVNENGSAYLLEDDAVKPGYFVQVYGSASSNESDQTAGLYLNPDIVARSAFGEVINFGPDPTSVGFGGAALPTGASAVPLASMTPPVTGAPPPVAGAPLPPTASPPVPGAPVSAPLPPVPTPAPNTAFVAAAAGAPPPPPAIPGVPVIAAPVHVMTAAANGATYEQMIANNWTDALLVQHGMMIA